MLDLVICIVASVLEFLQDRFFASLSPSTLKVYVVVIAAFYMPLGVGTLRKYHLLIRFLCGTLRMRPIWLRLKFYMGSNSGPRRFVLGTLQPLGLSGWFSLHTHM